MPSLSRRDYLPKTGVTPPGPFRSQLLTYTIQEGLAEYSISYADTTGPVDVESTLGGRADNVMKTMTTPKLLQQKRIALGPESGGEIEIESFVDNRRCRTVMRLYVIRGRMFIQTAREPVALFPSEGTKAFLDSLEVPPR